MANQIKLDANINPANTAVEASTDSGATWRAVAMSTVGSQQEGILTNVAAGTYAAGTVKLRAVAAPSVVVSNPVGLTVVGGAIRYADVVMFGPSQSNDSGLSPRSALTAPYYNTDTRVKSWQHSANQVQTYSLGTIGPDGNPLNANDHGITKALVPSYDNGFGPDVALVNAWVSDTANAGQELFIFKIDLTPPQSSNGSTVAFWNSNLYPAFKTEWDAFKAALISQGYTVRVVLLISGLGESDDGNPNFLADFTALVQKFETEITGVGVPKLLNKKQVSPNSAAAQAQYVAAHAEAKLVTLPNPTFLPDNLHYSAESMLRLGALDYATWKGTTVALPSIARGQSAEETNAGWTRVGTWENAVNPNYSGGYAEVLPPGAAGYREITVGGPFAIDSITQSGILQMFDVYIDGVKDITVTIPADGGSGQSTPTAQKYLSPAISQSLHTVRLVALASYNAYLIFDRLRVLP